MKSGLHAIAAVAFASLTYGCGGDGHYYDGYAGGYASSTSTNVLRVDIDTGETLTADAGQGAGLFVEYVTGGAYHVFSTCDTDKSGFSCEWRMVASVDPTLALSVKDDGDLEKDDVITRIDKGAVNLLFNSDSDFDGAVLTVPAGEKLRLNVLLDGAVDASLVNWVSDGSVRTGAPSDPVDFVPTSP